METTEELYQDLVLDHFKNPRCQDPVVDPSVTHLALNPLCGDRVSLAVKSTNGIVNQIALEGKGCCISQAAASMLSDLCQGKSLEKAQGILNAYRSMMLGEKEYEQVPELEEARSLIGVRKFTARMRCALLGCDALDHCIKKCSENCAECSERDTCPDAVVTIKHPQLA